MSEVQQMTGLRVVVDRVALSRLLRFREGTTTVDARVEKLVNEAISEGYSLLEPAAVYRNVSLEAGASGGISVDGGRLYLEGASIVKHLSDSSLGTIMAVTVGGGVTVRVKELSEAGEMARAAVLDAFGSEAVEGLADLITARISSDAREVDSSLTSRFSPGYGDLSLESQKDILEYAEARRIGISLSRAFTMIPEKSITAIVGWTGRKR